MCSSTIPRPLLPYAGTNRAALKNNAIKGGFLCRGGPRSHQQLQSWWDLGFRVDFRRIAGLVGSSNPGKTSEKLLGWQRLMALSALLCIIRLCCALSCELGLKESTGPAGGTQKGEHRGGPTSDRAVACRRRLAAKAKPRPGGGLGASFVLPRHRQPLFVAATACIGTSVPSSSLPSPRGIFGHSAMLMPIPPLCCSCRSKLSPCQSQSR